ncbi:MAG: VCBS repeat-containing protein, partial [Desulfobulbaceae bacterium]|nr:VCBS repeat-containing protein [Desulfobulbaceae bacterium]
MKQKRRAKYRFITILLLVFAAVFLLLPVINILLDPARVFSRDTGCQYVGCHGNVNFLKMHYFLHFTYNPQYDGSTLDCSTPATDFNADDSSDILWSNDRTGETAVWLMDATGKSGSLDPGTETDTTWTVFGPGDFDGDGYADILWINETTNEMKIWFIDAGGFASELDIGSADLSNYDLYGPADFNADGTADLLWRHSGTGQMYFW